MKIRIFLCVFMLMLCTAFSVQAEETEYIVRFKDGYIPDTDKYGLTEVYAPKGLYTACDIEILDEIKEYIKYTEVNGEIFLDEVQESDFPSLFSTDTYYSEQWWLDFVNMPVAWNWGADGEEIKVAVIDSGCNLHADIQNNLLAGYNYSEGNTDVTDVNTDSKGNIQHHGTHVSGIIAAEANNIGIKGIAPKVKIVPIKCFSPGTSALNIAKAIYEAVSVYGCKVINMSWGTPTDYTAIREAVADAADLGTILIAAVGNDYSTTKQYPAAYDEVIGVGSVNQDRTRSDFSNYNAYVTIAAPGSQLYSLRGTDAYAYLSGTSQAAPVISGIAAAALSVKPDLTPEEFTDLLTSTAEDLGDAGYDTSFGYGLVNAGELMNKLLMDYYVSPVNVVGTEANVVIKNNTGDLLKAMSLMVEYSGGVVIDMKKTELNIPAGEEKPIRKTIDSNSKVSHFLWDYNFRPLSPGRDYEG